MSAELAGADEFEGVEVGGLVVEAVGDHELDAGGGAGGDHAAALGGGDVHGLLAEDVLAGAGGAEGVLGVHGVGEGDVDGVDGGVGGDAVEVFVVCRWRWWGRCTGRRCGGPCRDGR